MKLQVFGTVMIQVFHTVLRTPDNQKVIIPNSDLSNASAINYSAFDTRRANLKLGVSFDSDIKRAKAVIREVADKNPLVLQDPEPVVAVGEHGDHGYVVYVRLWAKNSTIGICVSRSSKMLWKPLMLQALKFLTSWMYM